MRFATALAESYAVRGGSARDLFGALAGLVAAEDAELAARVLTALEAVLERSTL